MSAVHSMTGFGRGEAADGALKVVIELRSVNHRFLDLSLRMGRHFRSAEPEVSAVLRDRLGRGRVELFLEREELCARPRRVVVDADLAAAIAAGVRELEQVAGIVVPDEVVAARVLRQEGVLGIREEALEVGDGLGVLRQALAEALDVLVGMRASEGARLVSDLELRLDRLAELTQRVGALAAETPGRVYDRIRQRLASLSEEGVVDPERVATEAAVLADRLDISEEVTRLLAHIEQAREVLAAGGVVGRRLDFLVQELNREVNTIGSKGQEPGLHAVVIDMKSEVEKIREQVQNVE